MGEAGFLCLFEYVLVYPTYQAGSLCVNGQVIIQLNSKAELKMDEVGRQATSSRSSHSTS